MERRILDHSVIVSAWRQGDEAPLTLLCHEMGDDSIAVKTFCDLARGTELTLNFQFWDRSVQAHGSVLELKPYNGAYEGVVYYQVS